MHLDVADSRYLVNSRFRDRAGREYLANTLYPDVPVSADDWYVITTAGDRYDLLSQQFYSTTEFWWIIAVANGQPVDTLCPEIGIQIRIPAHPTDYVALLEEENR